MIYKSSYKKYIRRENLQNGGLTFIKRLLWTLCVSALAIAAHLLLRFVLSGSVDAFAPTYMYETLFGNLYIYILFAMLMSLIFLLTNPRSVSFPELYNNRWYLYSRMGLAPASMAKVKLNSTLWAMCGIYAGGYVIVAAFCWLMGIPLVVNYVVSLFLVGLVYILFICLLSMGISVFMKSSALPRVAILLSFVIVQFLLYSGGFYSHLQPTVFTIRVASLLKFSPSSFLVIFCVAAVLCQLLVALRANAKAVSENTPAFDPHAASGSWSRSTKDDDAVDDSSPRRSFTGQTGYAEQSYTRDQIIPPRARDDQDDDPYGGYRRAAVDGEQRGVGGLVVLVVLFILLALAFIALAVLLIVPGMLEGTLGQGVISALGLGEGAVRMLEMLGQNLWGKVGIGLGAMILIAVVVVLFVMIGRRRRGE